MQKKYFEFITSNKTYKKPVSEIIKMTERLEKELQDFVVIRIMPIRTVYFPNNSITCKRLIFIEKKMDINGER